MSFRFVQETHYGLIMGEVNHCDYAFAKREDIKPAMMNYCQQNLCYLDTDIIANHSCLSKEAINLIKQWMEQDGNKDLYESFRYSFFSEFVDEVIEKYGVSHFLATHDAKEMNIGDWIHENKQYLDKKDIDKLEYHFLSKFSEVVVYRVR